MKEVLIFLLNAAAALAMVMIACVIAVTPIVLIGIHATNKALKYFFRINERQDRTNV